MKKEELIKEADSAQMRGERKSMEYYDKQIEIENDLWFENFKRMIDKGKRIWIVPKNDLEAKTIIEMLQREREEYIVTGQGWGASWDMLEPSVFEELRKRGLQVLNEELMLLKDADQAISEIDTKIGNAFSEYYSLENQEQKAAKKEKIKRLNEQKEELLNKRKSIANTMLSKIDFEKSGLEVRGVELKGNSHGAINVDHHSYGKDDDRSNSKSSIEQVADVLGVKLKPDEQFVSANDKNFIPGMEELGAKLGLSAENLQEIIVNIRMRDREMQGITSEHEAQAIEAIEKLGDLRGKRDIIMTLPHSKCSTVADRLYGLYDNLLILSEDGETNFFGETEIINMLMEKFEIKDEFGRSNCWKGGNLEGGNGFWGGSADQDAIKKAVQEIIQKQQSNETKKQEGYNFEDDNGEK